MVVLPTVSREACLLRHDGRSERKVRTFRQVWNIFTWALIGVVVLIALALAGVRLVGLQPYTVLSGSMEPTYKTGSVIYVRKTDYRSLRVGDPITFLLSENTVATHRIVEIVPDADDPETLRFRTKGDNNDTEDGGLVHYKNVIGRPLFSIPYLGYLANYIQHPPGMYVSLAGCAALVLLSFVPDLFPDGKKER